MNSLPRKLIVLGIAIALVVLTGSVLLEQPIWCVSADGSPAGCAELTLTPSEATGDFYVDGVLAAQAKNIGQLVLTPDVEHTIDVKNIQSTEASFGTLFNYTDVSTKLTVKTGETKTKTIKLAKNYLRGTLELTCDIKNYAGENVACGVAIDGTAQPATVAAGQKASYVLDPGSHSVVVSLSGDPAQTILWAPASITQAVDIKASAAPKKISATFKKAGRLIATLNQLGVVGDWYLDGTLLGTQIASIDQWVEPVKSHKIEIKNIADPAAVGMYTWKDASQSVTVKSGETKNVSVKLSQQWFKGFLHLTCAIAKAQPGMYCQPSIDGVSQASIQPDASVDYTLDVGAHKLEVTLGGSTGLTANPVKTTTNIRGGQTTNYTARLTPKMPPYSLTIVNGTSTLSICSAAVLPDSAPLIDLLRINMLNPGEIIMPGASRLFGVASSGDYNVGVRWCDGPFTISIGFTIDGNETWYASRGVW